MKAEEQLPGQLDMFNLDIWCGRMSQERLVPESLKVQTSKRSCKKSVKSSAKIAPLFLSLKRGGTMQETSMEWEMTELPLVYRGEHTMLNTGESPNVVVESLLSQILEEHPHPNFNLSEKACRGILRRAEARGKELPKLLRETLEKQSHSKNGGGKPGGGKGILIQNEKTGALNVQCGQSVCYGISPYHSDGMKSSNPHSGIYEAETSRTLDPMGSNPACNQGGLAVVSYGVDSHNVSVQEEMTGTMIQAKNDKHSVPCVYGIDRASFNQGKNAKYDISIQEEIAQPLVARGPGGVMTP